MARRSTPTVRVPGYSRDNLRAIDSHARKHGLSRAAWIRLVTLSVAQGRTLVNFTSEKVRGLADAQEPEAPASPVSP